MGFVLVGCGKMGGAMLEGWLEQGISPDDIVIVEPSSEQARHLTQTFGVTVVASGDEIADSFNAEIIILAVKPQVMGDVAPLYQKFVGSATFVSIAAGKTLGFYEDIFGRNAAVIRVMPNTPAAVRRGMSGVFANAHVSEAIKTQTTKLLEAIGDVVWLEREEQMDALTAVSGSGPAYVFYFTECLIEAGIKAGLPKDMAVKLARSTVAGAGELMIRSPQDAGTLRKNVTSPGGTTEAALSIFMKEDGMGLLTEEAVHAAAQRSKELAG